MPCGIPERTDETLVSSFAKRTTQVASKSLDYLQKKYVEQAALLPLYGMTFFYVRRAAEEQVRLFVCLFVRRRATRGYWSLGLFLLRRGRTRIDDA